MKDCLGKGTGYMSVWITMRGRRGEVGKQSRNPFLYGFDFRARNRGINLLILAFATGMNLPPLPHALQEQTHETYKPATYRQALLHSKGDNVAVTMPHVCYNTT